MSNGVLGYILPAATIGAGALIVRPQRGFFPAGGKPIIAQATIRERSHDELEITDHPIENNAAITDHAFKRPAEVTIEFGWSNSASPSGGLVGQAIGAVTTAIGGLAPVLPAIGPTISAAQSILRGNSQSQIKALYQQLLDLQVARVPFSIYTGKRKYKDMLFRSLSVETDAKTENLLLITAQCRQVILVQVRTVTIGAPASDQADPGKTGAVTDVGSQQCKPAADFVPDAGSFSAAGNSLQSSLSGATQLISQLPGGIPGLPSALQGALAGLPENLASMTESITEITSSIGLPSTIPFPVEGAQSMSISLGSAAASAQAGLTGALEALPATLASAQGALGTVLKQLPSLVAQLPEVISTLPDVLSTISEQISSMVSKIPQVLDQVTGQVSGIVSSDSNLMRFVWNPESSSWVIGVADSLGAPMVSGIPMVPGTDLLSQFKYLRIGSGVQMVTKMPGAPEAVPQYGDLATSPLYVAGPRSAGVFAGP